MFLNSEIPSLHNFRFTENGLKKRNAQNVVGLQLGKDASWFYLMQKKVSNFFFTNDFRSITSVETSDPNCCHMYIFLLREIL